MPGLSLIVVNRGYSLVVLPGLLFVMASLVSEQRLLSMETSVAEMHWLSCLPRCTFQDEELTPGPLH